MRVAECRQNGRVGETTENRARSQAPVDNVAAENTSGARPACASTPAEEREAVLVNWEEIVRRALFRVNRGDSTHPPNETFSEPTLSRDSRRNGESDRELSVRRAPEDSESGSSNSDSEINGREIAATATSAAFSGTGRRDASGTQRSGKFRPGNVVKAFKDWHINFSGSSSDGAEDFL